MTDAIKLYCEALEKLEQNGHPRKATFSEFLVFRDNALPYIIRAKRYNWKISLGGLLKFKKMKGA